MPFDFCSSLHQSSWAAALTIFTGLNKASLLSDGYLEQPPSSPTDALTISLQSFKLTRIVRWISQTFASIFCHSSSKELYVLNLDVAWNSNLDRPSWLAEVSSSVFIRLSLGHKNSTLSSLNHLSVSLNIVAIRCLRFQASSPLSFKLLEDLVSLRSRLP